MTKSARLVLLAWMLSILVGLVAFIAWGQMFAWNFSSFSAYQLFPLFGLLAFSLMWSHYIVAAGRKYHKLDKEITKQYFEATSWVVLLAICLHPGILIWQLWRDGLGLPPGSYYTFVGPSMKVAVTLGTVSLLIFLAYEFRRKFGKKAWWKYVQYASDVAMLAIILHSLKLGSNLQTGWLRYLWYFYAVTYVGALFYLHAVKSPTNKKPLAKSGS